MSQPDTWRFPDPRARLVVSAENTPYMAWQAKLFAHSAMTRLGVKPVIVVHERDPKLHRHYVDLRREVGCLVIEAPSCRRGRWSTQDYAPRNTAGSLLAAARAFDGDDTCDRFVLCDPDMVFAESPEFPLGLSADRYSYHNGAQMIRRAIARAEPRFPESLLEGVSVEQLHVGVPYVIPAEIAEDLALEWLALMDVSERGPVHSASEPLHWTDVMWTFSLAAIKITGAPPTTTDLHVENHSFAKPNEAGSLTRPVIHYCQDDAGWDKRSWLLDEDDQDALWNPPELPADSIHGELFRQLRMCRTRMPH